MPGAELPPRATNADAGSSAAPSNARRRNIRDYAELQIPPRMRATIGAGPAPRPDRPAARYRGAYIPAGRYPLPSTCMMTVIPAQVAGVPNVCVASPQPVAEIFGTAPLLGVAARFPDGRRAGDRRFRLRHADRARADRIVGPGNIYVAAAKKLLAGEVGIDFVAGPTEILIIAAEGDPAWLAADMLAQAEHDVDASAVLLTTSKRLAAAVAQGDGAATRDALTTAAVARKAIDEQQRHHHGATRWTKPSRSRNRFAPEHLSIPDASLLPRHSPCRQRVPRAEQSRSRRRLCIGSEPRAAHQRRGARARRAVGCGLRQGDLGAGAQRGGARSAWLPPSRRWPAPKAWKRTRARWRSGRNALERAAAPQGRASTWRRTRRPPGAARTSCASTSTKTPWAARRASSTFLQDAPDAQPTSPSIPSTSRRSSELAEYFRVADEQMLFTNGTDEAIQVLINTYVDDER